MPELETPETPVVETPALPSDPSDDLWVSASEQEAASQVEAEATPPAPEVDAAPEAEAAEVSEPAKAERGDDGKFKAKSAKPRDNPVERMKQATAQAAEAKREAAEAKSRLQALEAELARARQAPSQSSDVAPKVTAKPTLPQTRPRPDFSEFAASDDPMGDHAQAVADWALEQRDYRQGLQQREKAAADRYVEARGSYPDLDQMSAAVDAVAAQVGIQGPAGNRILPPALLTAITASPNIGAIIYGLGQHPEIAAQWIRDTMFLPDSAATVVQRSLEATFRAPAAAVSDTAPRVPLSNAKPPINRVGGSASAAPMAVDDLPFEDFMKAEDARERASRRR